MTWKLSDYLESVYAAYVNLHKEEEALETYLREIYDERKMKLNDDTPLEAIRSWNKRIARLKGHPYPAHGKIAPEMPHQINDAYELLHTTAYGTDRLIYGDPNKIHGSGKPLRGRTSSGQTETMGPAVKKGANSQKHIILSEPAFHLKRKIDKKLRSVARDIYRELSDTPSMPQRCGCGRYLDDSYRFCPYCGREQ